MQDFPDDYVPPAEFHRQHPHVHSSMNALRWELRFRRENGMVDAGAVVERRADPRATRPTLLMSPSRYFAWLRAASKGAA